MARILFVDDDPMTLETLTRAVEVVGHQAVLASSGQEALEVAVQDAPDMIFVDLSLPDMSGLALLQALREQEITHTIPTLVLSAGPEMDLADRARNAGARAYLSKPIRLQALLDVIEEYTGKG